MLYNLSKKGIKEQQLLVGFQRTVCIFLSYSFKKKYSLKKPDRHLEHEKFSCHCGYQYVYCALNGYCGYCLLLLRFVVNPERVL